MPATKGERGHQRGPQIQLGRASEAFKRTDGLRRWRASDAAEKASEAEAEGGESFAKCRLDIASFDSDPARSDMTYYMMRRKRRTSSSQLSNLSLCL